MIAEELAQIHPRQHRTLNSVAEDNENGATMSFTDKGE